MGLFAFLHSQDINEGLKTFKKTNDAILLDVRTFEEYTSGHVPGSFNIPLVSINSSGTLTSNKDAPIFVYCYSGARSRQAAALLKRMGYKNVSDIGGISNYKGKVER